MNDEISIYDGVSPEIKSQANWLDVIMSIKNGDYALKIETGRKIADLSEYREFKRSLPAVTFCGSFNGRRHRDHVLAATGFIVADFDHVENVDEVFEVLCRDDRIWFVFRSPSGHGIKCGLRAHGIIGDEDIKAFYAAMEDYFLQVYGLVTDPACKDIARLTFLSSDPDTFVNPEPVFFNYESWTTKPQKTGLITPPVYESEYQGTDAGKQRYAMKVLESSCEEIRRSQPGNQHHTRLRMAFLVGGYVHYLSESMVLDALESAVRASGAKDVAAAMKTVAHGLKNGMAKPITIPDLVQCATNDGNDGNDGVTREMTLSDAVIFENDAAVTLSAQKMTLPDADRRPRYHGNMAADIKQWLDNRTGCVTKKEIWDEFGLVHPRDKATLRQVLHSLTKREYIYKDRYKVDTYWVKEEDFQYDDLDDEEATGSSLLLPLSLHDLMTVPRGSVFLLEGCTNAGKTAFCFNVLRANFSTDIPLRYVYSEGSKGEVNLRVQSFVEFLGDSREEWKQHIKTVFFPNNHHQFIHQQNPTGLTVVDYVRAVDGDFTKIGPAIDLIAESAGNGFVMVCVQKKTGSSYGVGGQNNHFAPRNVFSLDFVDKDGGYDFCVLTIRKCKYPKDYKNNPDGKEIHFAIRGGVELIQLSQPMFCDDAKRKQLFPLYKNTLLGQNNPEYRTEVPF